MSSEFDRELREQLAEARRALAAALRSDDREDAEAYRGRITGLLRIAAHHGIELPHSPEEELAD